MTAFIARRLLGTLPVVMLIAVFVFGLVRLAPGDPAALVAGDSASRTDIDAMRNKLGLDRPLATQFVGWSKAVLHGDLGASLFSGLPVTQLIGQRAEPTAMLALSAMLLATLMAVPLGAIAAWNAGRPIDRAVLLLSVGALAMPVFLFGYLLSLLFAVKLGWFPVQGYRPLAEGLLPCLRSLVLPALTLSLVYLALLTRITRASVLEVLGRDYIKAAHAKGLGTARVLFGHALRSACVPVITTIGNGFALLVGGSVVTESVFGLQGLGLLTVDAVLQRDYPVIQGLILLFAGLYLALNLTIDLVCGVADPRVGVAK